MGIFLMTECVPTHSGKSRNKQIKNLTVRRLFIATGIFFWSSVFLLTPEKSSVRFQEIQKFWRERLSITFLHFGEWRTWIKNFLLPDQIFGVQKIFNAQNVPAVPGQNVCGQIKFQCPQFTRGVRSKSLRSKEKTLRTGQPRIVR